MNAVYQVQVDKRVRTRVWTELITQSTQVRAVLQRLALFPEKGTHLAGRSGYRVITNDLKVLYTVDPEKRSVTVYWLAKTI